MISSSSAGALNVVTDAVPSPLTTRLVVVGAEPEVRA